MASVASFFVSRIDSLVDDRIAGPRQLLDTTEDPAKREKLKSLVGKIAIANAKIAYARYKELYAGDRWKNLVEKAPTGKKAMPQRLLWASTSTRNSKYPKTIYVDELIDPETVNTVPAETLTAYREQGRPRPSLTQAWAENLEQARQTMATLAEVGISMKEITGTLLADEHPKLPRLVSSPSVHTIFLIRQAMLG